MLRLRSRSRRRHRGQTLVEFALILPIFIVLVFGLFDFGRAVYAYNTVSNAAREAVRLGIVNQNIGGIKNKGSGHAVSLGVGPDAVTVAFLQPNYTSGGCSVAPHLGCIVQVEVQYSFVAATPVIGNLVGTIDLVGSSRQPIERTRNSP